MKAIRFLGHQVTRPLRFAGRQALRPVRFLGYQATRPFRFGARFVWRLVTGVARFLHFLGYQLARPFIFGARLIVRSLLFTGRQIARPFRFGARLVARLARIVWRPLHFVLRPFIFLVVVLFRILRFVVLKLLFLPLRFLARRLVVRPLRFLGRQAVPLPAVLVVFLLLAAIGAAVYLELPRAASSSAQSAQAVSAARVDGTSTGESAPLTDGVRGQIRGPLCVTTVENCFIGPVPGLYVAVTSNTPGFYQQTTTDENGEFSFKLDPGRYFIGVVYGGKTLGEPVVAVVDDATEPVTIWLPEKS